MNCLGLVGDICETYKSNVRGYINEVTINHMISILRKTGNDKYIQLCSWAVTIIGEVLEG